MEETSLPFLLSFGAKHKFERIPTVRSESNEDLPSSSFLVNFNLCFSALAPYSALTSAGFIHTKLNIHPHAFQPDTGTSQDEWRNREMNSRRSFVPLFFIFLLLLAGCAFRPPIPEEQLVRIEATDNAFLRGHLSIGPSGGTFTQCDTNSKLAIIDRTGDELLQVYQELAYEPEAEVYIEVLGRTSLQSEKEVKELTILKLHHAAVETRGCEEDLKGFSFRAAGNEPFWHIVITNENISFMEMGKPEILFPPANPSVAETHWNYSTETAAPPPQRLVIYIQEEPCHDTMSGAFFSFNANIRLENRAYNGCARRGWEQKAFMTVDDIKNAVYFSEWSSRVRLTNGIYRERIVQDSATELIVRLGNYFAFGDLNHNGVNEAAAILITDGGGSGTFRDLVVLTNCNGSPKHIATASLGDRVRVQSLTIRSGHILVEMITHGPNDPMASPSLRVWEQYRLQQGKLVKINKQY